MKIVDLRSLLVKHFGQPKHTLTIDGKEKSNCKEKYFYDDSKIKRFINTLNNNIPIEELGNFQGIKRYYNKDEKISQALCSKLYIKSEKWVIDFYCIKEIEYEVTKNGIRAKIKLDKFPIASLSRDRKYEIYGLFSRPFYKSEKAHKQECEGISYWNNKMLHSNDTFREFIVDFLMIASEDICIFKDMARTIKNSHCFLPEINSYMLSMYCMKPSDIFDALKIDYDRLKINPNKIDINVLYIISKLYQYIDPIDINILKALSYEDVVSVVGLRIFFNGMNNVESIKDIIINMYINKFTRENVYDEKSYMYRFIKDYVDQSISLDKKVRLNLSLKQLRSAHDNISYKID